MQKLVCAPTISIARIRKSSTVRRFPLSVNSTLLLQSFLSRICWKRAKILPASMLPETRLLMLWRPLCGKTIRTLNWNGQRTAVWSWLLHIAVRISVSRCVTCLRQSAVWWMSILMLRQSIPFTWILLCAKPQMSIWEMTIAFTLLNRWMF